MTKTTLLIHPRTGLRAIGHGRRGPIWPILGGAPDDDQGGDGAREGDDGKPDDKPVDRNDDDRRFSQTEMDRAVEDRLRRERAKHGEETRDLRKKAADADRLQKQHETDQEKAVREAREQGETAARSTMAPRLVLAEMRAAASGRIDPDRFAELTEDVDLSRYLTDTGEVDMDRVRRKVDAWAPHQQGEIGDQAQHGSRGRGDGNAQTQGQQRSQPGRPKPDPSQGSGRPGPVDGQRGVDEARRRFGNRARGAAAEQTAGTSR